MNGALRLGKILGIPFRLHYTWFIIFAWITFALSRGYFPVAYPLGTQAEYWAIGLTTSLLFFGSLLAHELAHSVVAKANGTPVRSITLFIFGGVAQITREASRPATELLTAIAGPLCSLVLGGLFGLIWLATRGLSEPVSALVLWLAQVNIGLAIFNMVPGFPLDGGRVLRSILWHTKRNYQQATRIASLAGRVVAYALILGGIILAFTTGTFVNALFFVFVGWFLDHVARTSYGQLVLREALRNVTAAEVITTNYATVSPSLNLKQLVEEYIIPHGYSGFLVADQGRLDGIITLKQIKRIPQKRRDTTLVKETMTPANSLEMVHPSRSASAVMEQMTAGGVSQVLVVQDGRVIGLVVLDSLRQFIRIRSERGK